MIDSYITTTNDEPHKRKFNGVLFLMFVVENEVDKTRCNKNKNSKISFYPFIIKFSLNQTKYLNSNENVPELIGIGNQFLFNGQENLYHFSNDGGPQRGHMIW
jgi:hypothetical protein